MPPTESSPILSRRVRFAIKALCRVVFAWALAIWAVLGLAWNALGRYDLALSELLPAETAAKFPRGYQAVAMVSAWLSSWEFWTIGGLVLAFGAAVEYGVRAEQRAERRIEARRKAAAQARREIPPDAPIARIHAFMESLARALTESPNPQPPRTILLPEPDPEPEWDRLYELDANGRDVHLLLVPFTDDPEGNTLLLVLYGYKIKLGMDRVSMSRAVAEACRAEREAPNASMQKRAFGFQGLAKALEPEKYGKGAIDRGEVETVDLSKGGRFEITDHGVRRADDLARDLIRRA